MHAFKCTGMIQNMDAEVRRIIEEKNRAEAVKASLERDNNNLKVSEINIEIFALSTFIFH